MGIIAALLVLSFLVFIHELGHFLAAKYFKMPVHKFAIGFGPAIFKKKVAETEYRINIFPLGGYVAIAGEEDPDDPIGFLNYPIYKRFTVLIGGIVFNFIGAVLLFAFVFSIYGVPERGIEINGTLEGSSVSEYVEANDQLVSINGHEVNMETSGSISEWIKEGKNKDVVIEVRRNQEVLTFKVPLTKQEDGKEVLGISYSPSLLFVKKEDSNLAKDMLVEPLNETVHVSKLIGKGLGMLFTGQVAKEDIQGPVGIIKTTSDISNESFALLLYWTALLSINLAIFNALPIPALDGGQILFLFLEKIMGKRWNKKYAAYVQIGFFFLLIGFIIVVTFADITRMIGN